MLHEQFCTLNISKAQLEEYLRTIGYWGTPYLEKRNAFVLSPCGYLVNKKQQAELNQIGKSVYAALGSVAQRLHQLGKKVPSCRADQELLSIATRGSKKLLTPNKTLDGKIPPLIKVDLVQNAAGDYFVVEVDAYNPRGLGFNALFDGMVALDPGSHKVCPTITHLADMLADFSPNRKLCFLVSDYERYYLPSFEILQAALLEHGVELMLVRERDFAVVEDFVKLLSAETASRLFMIPESLGHKELKQALLKGYQDGSIKLFFPPKAYLGSKLLLPYIGSQAGVNGFIPPTGLLSKNHSLAELKKAQTLVLKAGQSSGMKGVLFSDLNQEEFARCLAQESQKKRPGWILQQHVTQQSLPLTVFGDSGELTQDYYLRIIAQFSADGLLGLDITGRTDRMVHGAPDCVMLPAVLD